MERDQVDLRDSKGAPDMSLRFNRRDWMLFLNHLCH
jgi:hypothetical protein